MADAAAEALTPEQQAQTSRVKRMLLQIRQKDEPPKLSGGGGIKRNTAAALNEQWAMTMQSSMRELTEEQTSGHLVEERAAAYFANIESLRLLALQIVKGSAERPGYRAADGVGWVHQATCRTLSCRVRVTSLLCFATVFTNGSLKYT